MCYLSFDSDDIAVAPAPAIATAFTSTFLSFSGSFLLSIEIFGMFPFFSKPRGNFNSLVPDAEKSEGRVYVPGPGDSNVWLIHYCSLIS